VFDDDHAVANARLLPATLAQRLGIEAVVDPSARPPGHGSLHLGTLLGSFTFGHVRQLDRVAETVLAMAWAGGAGPGDAPMTIDVDATICEVHGHHKQGACSGSTRQLGDHPLLATWADIGYPAASRRWPRPPSARIA
jgi:hypothetical protein